MPTEQAQKLKLTIAKIDMLLAGGATVFQAMSTVMEDDDWLLAYVAFKTLVKEANEK